jgi:hypothetical protein
VQGNCVLVGCEKALIGKMRQYRERFLTKMIDEIVYQAASYIVVPRSVLAPGYDSVLFDFS